jgi:hypothetical protein
MLGKSRLNITSVPWAQALTLVAVLGCSSSAIDDGAAAGGAENSGDAAPQRPASQCSAALRQALSLVDEISGARVLLLDAAKGESTLYVDASAGGIDGGDEYPWVYLSLAEAAGVALSDLEALESAAWDLAFKRFLVRTNGGDSGPGRGGALRIGLPWDRVDGDTLGSRMVPTEEWFDEDCNLLVDEMGAIVTTYSGWSEYDPATHVLAPADAVFITRAAGGDLFKVAILDYYSNPDGSRGGVGGRYKLRVARLP